MAYRSILELFRDNVARHPQQKAALVKRDGAYQSVSWHEIGEAAMRIAGGLVELGVGAGDRVCLLCQTRLEWVEADMGILGAGGVTVPIYPSNLADECHFVIEDCGAVAVIAEDHSQVDKLRAERPRLPAVKNVVQITGEVPADDPWVVPMAALKKAGAVFAAANVERLAARHDCLNPDSIFTIIYTSGTTGRPKGVVTTHASVLWEAKSMADVGLSRTTDIQLLFLPLAHSFARTMMIGWMATRHILAFAESLDSIPQNLLEARPTVMGGVPRLYEKIFQMVVREANTRGPVQRRLFHAALEVSRRHGEAERRGECMPLADRLRFAALRATVFRRVGRKLQQALGGRMRAMGSGSAPIAPQILWFFKDAGLLLLEGYGLTESASGGFINQPDKDRIGSVGQVLPGMTAKLGAGGEVLLRGPNIMREYWNRPQETAEVLRDGWLHTGDIGELDADGYLWVTDRKKDLIITASGKNIAPQKIENLLKTHDLISQVMVHGDRRKFLSALITLDHDALQTFLATRDLNGRSYAAGSQLPEVQREVADMVTTFNRMLPRHETIKKFKILHQDFTQESGELTPTLKVKRKVVSERYQTILDGFYDEAH